jgi:hypothetical protein
MNWLKSGPEVKLPDIKAPDFLADLFYDLRDRNLLPLVGLLVVAIVAVPILLSGSSADAPSAAELNGELAALSAVPGDEGGVVVANSAPGLRDYRRRLSDLQATDPFKQHFAAPAPGGETSVTSESSGGEEVNVFPSGSGEAGGGSTSGGENTETAVVRTETKYASYEIDARIVNTGSTASDGKSKGKATVRRNLPELTMLPGRETPVIVFMGVSADAKKAMMLVSSDVQSIFGDALCVIGSQTCQLLAMEPGLPETFVYGGQGRIFRIEVLKIEQVVSGKPQRATLGSSPKGFTGSNRAASP